MLTYISSPSIVDGRIDFNEVLNVVLGANDGTNSIGKSSLLLLIDFAFGGDSFLKSEANFVHYIKDIDLSFGLKFNSIENHFVRSTNSSELLQKLVKGKYIEITLKEFKQYLANEYVFDEMYPSFRATVNPFSRIYGRGVDDPERPFAQYKGEAKNKAVNLILRLYGQFWKVAEFDAKKVEIEERIGNIKGAFKSDFVKSIKKKDLKSAEKELTDTLMGVELIKSSLDEKTVDYKNILSDINIKRQDEIDNLLRDKRDVESLISRIDRNLNLSTKVSKRHFSRLVQFFPEVNEEKLEDIENFHSKVSNFLQSDIKVEKKLLQNDICDLLRSVDELKGNIRNSTDASNSTGQLVDELLSQHLKVTNLQNQINFNYASESALDEKEKIFKESEETLIGCLLDIQKDINSEFPDYITAFYSNERALPELYLKKNSYIFSHNSDTGTGKLYANMISLDLILLNQTKLPYLIHDTIIFKPIQVPATEKIIDEYLKQSKQVFISLDEITRFSKPTQNKIISNKVVELSFEKPAFNSIWGNRDSD